MSMPYSQADNQNLRQDLYLQTKTAGKLLQLSVAEIFCGKVIEIVLVHENIYFHVGLVFFLCF